MTTKTSFFECSTLFKFNNLGLVLGLTLQFYTIVKKGLKVKIRKVWELNHMFGEVTEENLVGGLFAGEVAGLRKHFANTLSTNIKL